LRVLRLRLSSFRNLSDGEIEFAPGANLLVGANGQGKTNFLEAIYLLAYGRSFRTATPRECIRHSEEQALVAGSVERGNIERDVQVALARNEKRLYLHGKEAPLEEFVGNLHVLALTSRHLAVVRGGPDERRSFLDRAMLTLYPGYIRSLAAYTRALRQRNRLLASTRAHGGAADISTLESWDEKLVIEGARIAESRRRYVEEMKRALPESLFGGERLEVEYRSSASGGDEDVESEFRRRLEARRGADLALGFTTVGPHRDDLALSLEAHPLADYGSAGQQRSALLSLYFAQMEVHRSYHGHYPVFLLDDVEAELDSTRMETLLAYLIPRTQTFLTTTKHTFLPLEDRRIDRFEVVSGSARRSRHNA
jgi:DNA replication and repair protein RecF